MSTKPKITEPELRAILRERVKTHGRKAIAKTLGVHVNYVSMLMREDSDRSISDGVAAALGYRMHRVEQRVFEPIGEGV